jgi:polar amino acid transport system substrate-binding protein
LAIVLGLVATTGVAFGAGSAVPTKTAGTLTVGFDVPAPGFWNGRVNGTTITNPSGFEATLAQAIARQLGLAKVIYVRAPFGRLFSPVPKKYDVAFEEVTITAQRARAVSFSAPYLAANQGVLYRKGLAKPTSISALKSLQLCAQANSTGLSYIQRTLRPLKTALVYSASSSAAFDAVEAGKCDALILDVPIVVAQSRKKEGAYGGVAGQLVTRESYGPVLDKGSKLKPFLDKAIKVLEANGTIDRLQNRWLPFAKLPLLQPGPPSPPPPPPPLPPLPPPPPSASGAVTVSIAASPQTVALHGRTTIRWSSSNATACSASGGSNGWFGTRPTSGFFVSDPLVNQATYTITCTAPGTAAGASVTVFVDGLPLPTVTLSASPNPVALNGSVTLTWTSANSNGCTAPWTTSTSTSGSQVVGPLTASTSFPITCGGPGGTNFGVATVIVIGPPDTTPPSAPGTPTIAAISATSVTIQWLAATDNVGVAGYELYVDGTKISQTTGFSFTFDGLACGTSYVLGVDALDAALNRSAPTSISVNTTGCT